MDEFNALIEAVREALIALYEELSDVRLGSPQERQSASSRLFDTAPEMITSLAEALRSGHFPEIPDDPAELDDLQHRATELKEITAILTFLAQASQDGYLTLQSQAIVKSFDILRRTAAQDELIDEIAPMRWRKLRLAGVLLNLPAQGTKRGFPSAQPRYCRPKKPGSRPKKPRNRTRSG